MPRVNVVFHGTFAFLDWGSTLEVLIPDVRFHVYRAGTWEKEKDLLSRHTYTLKGVKAEAAVPDLSGLGIPLINTDKVRKINRDPALVFCSLVLPPAAKLSALDFLALEDPEQVLFDGKDATEKTKEMTSYATTHVLTYDCKSPQDLKLDGLDDWTPVEGPKGFINLHVFAEPDMRMPTDQHQFMHMLDSFDELVHLFDASLHVQQQVRQGPYRPGKPRKPVDGLPPLQQDGLVERMQRVHGAHAGGDVLAGACFSAGGKG
jgi:hypothetical protein